MDIKNIFFDFFGVVSSEVSPIWFAKYCKNERKQHLDEDISNKVDIGLLNEKEFIEIYAKLSNQEFSVVYNQLIGLSIIDNQLVELIKSLKEKYNVYLLSNACASYLRKILVKNNLYPLFDKIYISSDLKKIKPNKDFFEHILNDLHAEGNESIMIDDREVNINGAMSVGINGIVYKGVDNLKEILNTKYNIKI